MPDANRSLINRLLDALEIRQYLTRMDILRAALVITVTVPMILFAPRPNEATRLFWRLTIVELGGRAHIVKDPDAWEFEHDAAHPADLFTPAHRHWQSRPLSIGLAWALAQPFRLFDFPTKQAMTPEEGHRLIVKPPFPDVYNAYSPELAGYVLMNWLVLVGSVLLLKPLLRAQSFFEPRVYVAMTMLVANIVTKAFFWSPHVQIFSILLPMVSLIIARALLPRVPTLSLRTAAIVGAAAGVLALIYGAFVVTVLTAQLCILFSGGLQGLSANIRRKTVLSLALLGAFAAPIVTWMAIVVAKTGAFYSPETQRYHEFVWVYQRMSDGMHIYLPLMARSIRSYAEFALHASMIPALMIAILIVFFFRQTSTQAALHEHDDTRRAVIYYMIADSAFYMFMGFYAERLAWTIVPAVLTILGLHLGLVDQNLSGRQRFAFRAAVITVATGAALRLILKASGPHA